MYTGLVHIGTSNRLTFIRISVGLNDTRLSRHVKIFNPNLSLTIVLRPALHKKTLWALIERPPLQ